jgi:hypothetical protein
VFHFPGDGKYWIATDKGGQFEWRMSDACWDTR